MPKLFLTDTHIHNWTNFGIDPVTGLSRRLLDQQKTLSQIVHIAKEEKVDTVYFGGDLYHAVGLVSTECLNTAYKFFTALHNLGIKIYRVKGNHDIKNRKDPKWFHDSGFIFDNLTPPENIKFIDFHEEIDYTSVKGYDVVVIHQIPLNARVGNYVFPEGFNWKELAKNNKLVLIGHIHQRQTLTENCIVGGSPYHLTFGDFGDRGIHIIDDQYQVKFIKLKYPEFLTVPTHQDVKDDGNYYRVLQNNYTPNQSESVKVQVPVKHFEERIKADTFQEILKEWLVLNSKPTTYLDALKGLECEKFKLGRNIYTGQLLSVSIKNFCSLKEVNYDVKTGFTIVTGQNSTFDSNGSGKTSLFESIYWCLFGETTKGLTVDDVVRRGEKDCEVRLQLGGSGTLNTLNVSRSKKEGLRVWVKSIDKSCEITQGMKQTDRQKAFEAVLGFNKTLFSTACYFSQENLLMLTGLSDLQRTTLITNLLGFENYDTIQQQVMDKIQEKKNETTKIQQCVDINNGKLLTENANYTNCANNIEFTTKEIQEIKLGFADLELKETIAQAEIKQLSEQVSQIPDQTKVQSKIESVKIDEVTARNNVVKLETEKSLVFRDIEHVNKQIETLKKEIQSISKLEKGNHCDKCGASITADSIEAFVSIKNGKVETLKTEITLLNTKLVTIEPNITIEQSNKQRLVETIKQMESELKIQETNRNTLIQKKIQAETGLRYTLEALSNSKKQLQKLEDRLVSYNTILLNCKKTIAELILDNNTFKAKLEELTKEIEILEFWKHAFSSKGIRSLLLDRFCNEFNTIISYYLSEISNGVMSLTITPTNTIKTGEERNKVGIKVVFNGVEVPYSSLSGGEKRRVDCSLCFALSRYIMNKYAVNNKGLLGILILDEVFSYLDKSGEEALTTLLCREGRDKAVFVIDHALNLTNVADRIWTVRKEENNTTLETNSV